MNIHPKVAWPALVTPVVTLIEAILTWQHISIPIPVQIPAVTLIYLVVGWLAPSSISAPPAEPLSGPVMPSGGQSGTAPVPSPDRGAMA